MSRVLVNGQDVNYSSDFPEMTYDKWKELPEDLRPNYTVITDRDYTGEPIDNSVSVTADGVKTYGQLLTELSALVDYSKITRNSKIMSQSTIHSVTSIASGDVRFSVSTQHTQNRYYSQTIHLNLAKFYLYDIQNGTPTGYDFTNNVPTSGTTITLYYNIVSSGGVIDIQAEDVSYGSGTVKSALDGLEWKHKSVSLSPTSLSTTAVETTVPEIIGAKEIVAIVDLASLYIIGIANKDVYSALASLIGNNDHQLAGDLRVNVTTGVVGIRCSLKGTSRQYPTLTDLYYR